MLKYSRQRESIKSYLDTHRTHPTAETVYLDIKQEFPNISLGTVYRNLNLLAEMGEILAFPPEMVPTATMAMPRHIIILSVPDAAEY